MSECEMRITPKFIPDYTDELFKNWLDGLNASEILVAFEDKKYYSRIGVTEHFHLFIASSTSMANVRTSFKKVFPLAKGNHAYKMSTVRDRLKYLRYTCKLNNIFYEKNFPKEMTDKLCKEFEEENLKLKEENKIDKKKITKIQRIIKYIQDNNYGDIEKISKHNLMQSIIEYHLDRDVTFTEFDLKKLYICIRMKYQFSEQAKFNYIQELLSNINV